jgi:alpha-beta hydrolase superfamily lysophospholipase
MHRGWICFIVLFTGAVSAQNLPRRNAFGATINPDPQGVRVSMVVAGSPAAQAGLRVGDLITATGTRVISSSKGFLEAVRSAPASTPFIVSILRADVRQQLDVRLVPVAKESDERVDTTYSAISVGGSLRRTLVSMPKGATGRLPAVLLIGGIGCYSVDNPADHNDSYRKFAHDLSEAGLIVMRVEKSGIGDSQGIPCLETDFNSETEMYAAGLAALEKTDHVDPDEVFLFGHSIGTLIAPRLAEKNSVAGIIVAEAAGINWFEYELANLRRQSVLGGDSPVQTDNLLRSKEVCMHRLLIEHQPEESIDSSMPECKKRNSYPVNATYMQQVAALNVAEPWTQVRVPVLAVYGTADFVTAEADHQRIVDIVNTAHPNAATLIVIQGMDHHFEIMGTPQRAYEQRVEQHKDGPYAGDLSNQVAKWLCAHAACKPAA